jgi:hypothetical protein
MITLHCWFLTWKSKNDWASLKIGSEGPYHCQLVAWTISDMSLPVRGLSQQDSCIVQSPRPSPSSLPSRAHSSKEAAFPTSPSIVVAIFHQNDHGRSHCRTIHGLDSHTKERLEPQGNPYPGTDMEVRPWSPCGYSCTLVQRSFWKHECPWMMIWLFFLLDPE